MADFTEDQLKEAARKALDAGDVAAAKKLIAAARIVGGNPPAETVIRELPEGRIVRGASGTLTFVSPSYSTTDPAQIEKIMAGAGAGETSRQSINESLVAQHPIAARGISTVRGVPFVGSYLDEAAGAVFGPQAEAGVRAVGEAQRQVNPGENLALGIGGGLLGSAAALAALPEIAGGLAGQAGARGIGAIGRGLGLGAAAGATEGAVYGAGEGQGADRLGSAARGAAFGGAAGGLLGGAAPIVARGVENVMSRINRSDVAGIAKELGISEDAAKVIRQTFDQGGDLDAARAAIVRAGDEGMLADAGVAAQALLDASAQTGGTAGQITRDAIEGRMQRTGQAVDTALDATLGPAPLGPKTALSGISARTAPARSEAYQAAYSSPIDYSSPQGMAIESALARMEPKVVIRAVEEANANMRARGEANRQIMAMIGDNGDVVYREMPNVEQLDEIKKALQAIAYGTETNPLTGRLTGTGQRYNTLANDLRDAVAAAVPDYGRAVALGGDKLSEERAFMLGRDLLRSGTEIEDVMLELGARPSVDQLAAAKSGLRSYIAKTLGDVRAVASDPNVDARQVVKAVTDMSSDNARAKIKALLGKEADALLSQIDAAAQSAAVRASVAANSRTAVRQSVQETVGDITQPSALMKAAQGEGLNAAKSMVQAVTGQTSEYTAAQKQAIFTDIARALTERRGKSAVAALDYIKKAMAGQPLTDAQNNFVAQQLSAALATTAAPQAGRNAPQ